MSEDQRNEIMEGLADFSRQAQMFGVDLIKGAIWKEMVNALIRKYGIKDDDIFAEMGAAIHREWLPGKEPAEQAIMQDALNEVRAEARTLIKQNHE